MTAPRMKWEWSVGNILTIVVLMLGLGGNAALGMRHITQLEADIAMNARQIAVNQRDIQSVEVASNRLGEQATGQAIQLGRIEEQINGLRSDIGRVLAVIERRVE